MGVAMPQAQQKFDLNALRHTITHSAFLKEEEALRQILPLVEFPDEHNRRVHTRAIELVEYMREHTVLGVDAFLHEYKLSEREGVLLMCLAEALLRIPDSETADKLIEDKFSDTDWNRYVGQSDSFLVNASSWGLMLTGKVINFEREDDLALGSVKKLVHKLGAPVIRQAMTHAMEWMGTQFILGRSIEEGVHNSLKGEAKRFLYSFDMLGEGARTVDYAEEYANKYLHAIETIGRAAGDEPDMYKRPGISIKLSALHPRYEARQKQKVMDELLPQLKKLLLAAKKYNMIASIDAEEANRLDISLDIFESIFSDQRFKGWDGISVVVQAYQKRAVHVIHWLAGIADKYGKRIPVRLVKGAYWDSEIKHAQVEGEEGYPVFTRKHATDVSYLACAKTMLGYGKLFYPQFATHNAHTVASIMELAGKDAEFEFQRLHGMGGSLYDPLVSDKNRPVRCRVYAPIGVHKDLLAYLVRRLLENGANSSFINQIADKSVPLDKIITDPVAEVKSYQALANPDIPLPLNIYGGKRRNSQGLELGYYANIETLYTEMGAFVNRNWNASSLIGGQSEGQQIRTIINPANAADEVGTATECTDKNVRQAIEMAAKAFPRWARKPAKERADILRKAADLLEERRFKAMSLIVREAGRTMKDAVNEVREAVDFCRYYAMEIERLAGQPMQMPGPTGESNELRLTGRGVFACISPWNFPLAIFLGQVAAALAAGNTVLAKPAEQTPIIAWFAVTLLHEAGVPEDVLHLLLGDGAAIGNILTSDPGIAGIVFTGSTEVAQIIQKRLASRGGPIIPFIAETGGQNCMVVDSTALPEQVVDDAVESAFVSAGQRCSALRVLFLQEDIANETLKMLAGAINERVVGNPWDVSTDIGPVIDADAKTMLDHYKTTMSRKAKVVYDYAIPQRLNKQGTFVGPAVFEIQRISDLKGEVFGPILHVVRYQARHLDDVIDAINSTGYGLTMGIHSRIDDTARYIASRVRAGNIYINRGMTGAVVGVQPFGGEGLSGTGPKAGGPHYLLRMMSERTITVNTAAIGGNLALYAS